MRVLHVMEATIGGTRRHIVDVATGQCARGLDVHVAAAALRQPDFERDLERLEALGCGVMRLPMRRAIHPPSDWRHWRALARHIEELSPDIVHTHSSKAGVLGRAASIATGIGVRVHTPHTFAFLFEAMFAGWKRRLFREVESQLAGYTQALIAVSDSEARTFVDSGVVSPERVRIVPNGIDPSPWMAAQPLSRAALGVREGVPLAALVGLLNVAKGQDLALAMLAEPGLERLELLIAGHGEMRESLESQALRLAVHDRVHWLGYRTDVPALLVTADFTLVPSRWEGMPYILLESMAAARAVVSTPVDGSRDLFEDGVTGLLAREISPASLAEAVRALLATSPDARRAMGVRGRERILERYTEGRMVEGLIAVYRELA